jgi:hypothetical protein
VWVSIDDGAARLKLDKAVGDNCVTLNGHVSEAMQMGLALRKE